MYDGDIDIAICSQPVLICMCVHMNLYALADGLTAGGARETVS